MTISRLEIRSFVVRYGTAVLVAAGATWTRVSLEHWLGDQFTFVTLFAVVMFTLWCAGTGPALVALSCTCLLAAFFLLEPRNSFVIYHDYDQVALLLFVLACLGSVYTFQILRTAPITRSLIVAIGLVIALLLGTAALNYRHTRRLVVDADWVAHTEEVLDATALVILTVVDAETGQRGFIITGQDEFLEPYHAALARLGAQMAELKEKTRENAWQQARIKELEEMTAVRLALLKEGIDLRRRGEHQARSLELSNRDRIEMDRIRTQVAKMTQEETDLLKERQQRSIHSYQVAVGSGFFTAFVGLVVFGGFVYLLRRHLLILTKAEEERQYAKALREMDKNKNEFIATLAHELRNPLGAVQNAIHVLAIKGDDRPTAKQMQELIRRQVSQVSRLVEDLLDVSRISQGKIELRRECLDLVAAVERATETSRPLIDRARHQLIISLPQEPVVVEGDPARLSQVVSNLLNNAAKYTPDGGRVDLVVERQGGQAVIQVMDNGMGIPAEMLPRVFEMFSQVDQHRSRAQGGLGLGLALVRRLVEMHGGTIEAFSDGPGKGSAFTVRLPLASDARAAVRSPASAEGALLP